MQGRRRLAAAFANSPSRVNRHQRNPEIWMPAVNPLNTANPIAFPAAEPGNIIPFRQRYLAAPIRIFHNPNTSRDAVAYSTLPGIPG